MNEQSVTLDSGKSNITINIVINGVDAASAGNPSRKDNAEEIAAAIAAALEEYTAEDVPCVEEMPHDKESFKLTILPYGRCSSPWSLKAMTMRQAPAPVDKFYPLNMAPMIFKPAFRFK
ncbi:MAG: hypothetical protein KBS58_04660 [Bacteroidales bacterium]|nr:hypothetical protein [Candidatus Cacconaster equi]